MVGSQTVRAFLQRLFRRRTQSAFTCYLRENGPIAYELDLLGAEPRERAEAMMAGELSWAWKSGTREWTHLTRISLSAFLADLRAGVLLVASDAELPRELSDAGIAEWMRRFARLQDVPLAAVIQVMPDRQLLFVQQHAREPVNRLLGDWGLDKGAAVRMSYVRLGPASLESIADGL